MDNSTKYQKIKKFIKTTLIVAGLLFVIMKFIAKYLTKKEKKKFQKEASYIDNENRTIYEAKIKRVIDIILSFGGLIVLSPVYLIISLAILIDDPGPVLFTQKRVGEGKTYFKLHKFRSMKVSTPHNTATHLLENPEQYITKVGKFIRATSLDEIPQIWDIFTGDMSIIGPRPALWNQDTLVVERDKYGANDVKPGLTGWAQINGRDELEIDVKANLDGDYVKELKKGAFAGFKMDLKCFLGSITSVLSHKGVVEGGTGEMNKIEKEETTLPKIGFDIPVTVDFSVFKKVLITGANSYIGESFEAYAKEHYGLNFEIDTLDMIDESWREKEFSSYDVVFHVAGLAHADVGKVSEEIKKKYYAVNTDLAIETAQKAKDDGVKQFVFMSSIIIYGDSAPYGKVKMITADTKPNPANFYGDSKWQADKGVRGLTSEEFNVTVLRPPMIYGQGSKGNYPMLAKMAKKLPVFPNVENQRSMLHIDNLCEFICQIMIIGKGGVFVPQNREYTKTIDMVKVIAAVNKHSIWVTKVLKPAVWFGSKMPGKIGGLVNKAFGNLTYEQDISKYEGMDYQKVDLRKSITSTEARQKHILVVSQYFFPEQFRINDICMEWVKRGYKVTVLTGIPNYPEGKFYEGYGYHSRRKEEWNGIEIIRLPLIARGKNTIGMILNYVSFVISGFWWKITTKIKADCIFTFEVSPMTQALIGCWYAKKNKIPCYLYVQDLWPENVEVVTGINNPLFIKPIDKMVDYIYKHTDEIFATSPSFVEAICNRKVNVPKEKVHYWPQYAEDFYKPVDNKMVEDIPDDDSFKIMFTGNVGTAQGLDILPKVADLLKKDNIKFIIVGDGRYLDSFNKQVNRRGVQDKFIMISRQSAERIPELLAVSDVAFLSFQNKELWTMTIPAKLQSYMACGKPVVAAAKGESQRIINESSCGLCSKIGDADDLALVIKRMMGLDLLQMGKNSRVYFKEHFDKKKLMDQMDEFFTTRLDIKS